MSSRYNDPYTNYNPNSFVIKAKRTVYKWWCVVYRPVYKLTHNGNWPSEKNPENKYPTQATQSDDALKMAQQIMEAQSANVDNMIAESIEQAGINTDKSSAATVPEQNTIASAPVNVTEDPEIDLSNVDSATLDRANEIMERLAREAAEDAAKKQAEIDAAKKQAEENQRLAMIMQANQVDISTFIEEGKAQLRDQN